MGRQLIHQIFDNFTYVHFILVPHKRMCGKGEKGLRDRFGIPIGHTVESVPDLLDIINRIRIHTRHTKVPVTFAGIVLYRVPAHINRKSQIWVGEGINGEGLFQLQFLEVIFPDFGPAVIIGIKGFPPSAHKTGLEAA